MTDLKPGWKRVKFGEVVRLNKETCKDPDAAGISRVIGLEHLEPGDLRVRSWADVADGTTFSNRVRPGQVLFGKRRAYQRKVAVADFDAICSGDIYVFESADPKRLLPELLPFICQTEAFFEYAVGTSAGSLSPRTNWKSLAEYEFSLPPLEEQRRLIKTLSASTRGLDLYNAAFNSCLDVLRSELSSHFDVSKTKERVVRFGEIADVKHGYAFPGSGFVDACSALGEAFPKLVTPKNFTEYGELDFSITRTKLFKASYPSTFFLDQGDLVVLMTDLTPTARLLGAPGLLPESALQNQRVGLVRLVEPLRVRLRYLFYLLCSDPMRRQVRSTATGTTVRHTSPSSIRGCLVTLPTLQVQDSLIERWSQLTASRKTLDSRIEYLRKMHIKAIQTCLSGYA